MPSPRQDSSAESAARFLESRERKRQAARDWRRQRSDTAKARRRRELQRQLSRGAPAPAPVRISRRIAVDFAEPTLRLIHDVLLDALHAGVDFGERGALLILAEQTVAIALGIPPSDDPLLTDREVR
jgi:hypothetical protein